MRGKEKSSYTIFTCESNNLCYLLIIIIDYNYNISYERSFNWKSMKLKSFICQFLSVYIVINQKLMLIQIFQVKVEHSFTCCKTDEFKGHAGWHWHLLISEATVLKLHTSSSHSPAACPKWYTQQINFYRLTQSTIVMKQIMKVMLQLRVGNGCPSLKKTIVNV